MSFREKTAWVSLGAIALVYGWYFSHFLQGSGLPAPGLLGLAVAALAILQAVPAILFAALNPAEAKARADEREFLFEMRSTRAAYLVLIAGALACSVAGIHFAMDGIHLGNAALLSIVLAEFVKSAALIVQYRRGA